MILDFLLVILEMIALKNCLDKRSKDIRPYRRSE